MRDIDNYIVAVAHMLENIKAHKVFSLSQNRIFSNKKISPNFYFEVLSVYPIVNECTITFEFAAELMIH